MHKQYLRAPGPTPVPERVLLAMAQPIVHHRAEVFKGFLETLRANLKFLFQTTNEVVTFASSGTGGMEAAVANLLKTGDSALVVNGGKFGERWSELTRAYGIDTSEVVVEWGRAVDPAAVEAKLKGGGYAAVFWQASETSTGVMHPTRELADLCRQYDALSVVDGITALGVFNVPMDEWGLDCVLTGSQKALMLPPGLACVSVSERAQAAMQKSDLPKYYFNIGTELKNLVKNQTAYTPAISLMVGLNESLAMIQEEGLEHVFARHDRHARAFREAALALNMKLFAPDAPSPAVTALCAPDGIDGQKIYTTMRDVYHTTAAGGQGDAKGKIFRLSAMGYQDRFDVLQTVAALEYALRDLGHRCELGTGLAAALKLVGDA